MEVMMPTFNITDRTGAEIVGSVMPNTTLLEAIRTAGVDDLMALCGGCCSCATCHVIVAESDRDGLNPLTDDENELLESSSHRQPGSRLACQVVLTEANDGISVTIAPED